MNRPDLYLDLDGVFADFDGAFPAFFGFDHRTVSDEVMWKTINDYGTYFRDLPICRGAYQFFLQVSHLNPKILTACPRDDFENVANQKIGWIREHLSERIQIIPTPGGKTKPLYMRRPGDILIDDFESNIKRWRAAGGVGIHHTGDFAETLRILEMEWNKNRPALDTNRALSAGPVTTSDGTMMGTASVSAAATTKPAMANALRDRTDHVMPDFSPERYSLSRLGG